MTVYGLRSTSKLYGKQKGEERAPRKAKNGDALRIAVHAWFYKLLLTADKMPDTVDYVLPAPHKVTVWSWYITDSEENPIVYPAVSETYFLKVWREDFPQVKLRKYLRFSKCCYCVLHRAVRWNATSTIEQKKDAMGKLRLHYEWVQEERAHARVKQNLAIVERDKYLSIAIDGYLCFYIHL